MLVQVKSIRVIKNQAMNMYEGVEVKLHAFLTMQ
jgi:hypothetical protein